MGKNRSSNRSRVVEEIKPRFHQRWEFQLALAVWRWLPETVLLAAVVVASVFLDTYVSPYWVAPCVLIAPVAVLMLIPPVRRFVVAWFWVDVTRHRLRSFMGANGLMNRDSRRPWLLVVYPTKIGERAWMMTVAGISPEDIQERARNLGPTCYATDGEVLPHPKRRYLVRIDIRRRDLLDGSAPVASTLLDGSKPAEGQLVSAVPEGTSEWARELGLSTDPAVYRSNYVGPGHQNGHNGHRPADAVKKAAKPTNNKSETNGNISFVGSNGEDISDYV